MSKNHGCHPVCPTQTIVDPPIRVVRDFYYPQIVQVIHPIEIINRRHCVPVYQHCYTVVEREYEYGRDGDGVTLSGKTSKKKKAKR